MPTDRIHIHICRQFKLKTINEFLSRYSKTRWWFIYLRWFPFHMPPQTKQMRIRSIQCCMPYTVNTIHSYFTFNLFVPFATHSSYQMYCKSQANIQNCTGHLNRTQFHWNTSFHSKCWTASTLISIYIWWWLCAQRYVLPSNFKTNCLSIDYLAHDFWSLT